MRSSLKKFLFLALFALSGTLFALPNHPRQVSTPLNLLYQLNDTKQLIEQVEKEGQLNIKISNFGANMSNAAWIPDERTIYLNYARRRSVGSVVCSLVFELHNALSGKQFDHYDQLAQQGKISRDEYIAAIEYVEYVNACNTSKILNKGVHMGIFPQDAEWPTPPPFQYHFDVQKRAGHSALIGAMYDDMMRATR